MRLIKALLFVLCIRLKKRDTMDKMPVIVLDLLTVQVFTYLTKEEYHNKTQPTVFFWRLAGNVDNAAYGPFTSVYEALGHYAYHNNKLHTVTAKSEDKYKQADNKLVFVDFKQKKRQ